MITCGYGKGNPPRCHGCFLKGDVESMEDNETMRINRFLSHYGICSRREADRRIADGRVTIDEKIAVPGDQVGPDQIVCVDDVPVTRAYKPVLIAYHKPCGIICTMSDKEHPNLTDAIDYPERLFPVGRLDRDSSGLLLLTNDGELADELMRSRNNHEKEYVVETNKPLTDDVVKAMEQGVPLPDAMTKPCRIFDRRQKSFHIILTQGLNRQIRRMCDYFGYRVMRLHRIRFVNIQLGNLAEGTLRKLNDKETSELKAIINERKKQEGSGQ